MNYLAQLPVRVLRAKIIGKEEYLPVMVDGDYDGEYFAQYKWRVLPSNYIIRQHYEVKIDERTGQYIRHGHKQDIVYLHHLVLPKKEGLWVKHINGNRLDNRSVNLEYITPSDSALFRKQGSRRVASESPSSSQYRGVNRVVWSFNGKRTRSKSFEAKCRDEWIGFFKSEEEAARAYDKRAYEIWGDKATLNFPKEEK